MRFFETIVERASKSPRKTIVLPEGFDARVVDAAKMIIQHDCARPVIIGKDKVQGVESVDHLNDSKFDEYVNLFYEMRKEKGMTLDKAREIMKNPLYFGAMMVKTDRVDGMVGGVYNSSGDTIKCALITVRMAPGVKSFSTCTLMDFSEFGPMIFSDTAMYENPTAEEMAQIAMNAAKFYKEVSGIEPRVGMLSYSTRGSAKSESVQKVIDATAIVRSKAPHILIDGDLQFDAAFTPEVAKLKAPNSPIEGKANVYIFPELNSSNISVKVAERMVPGTRICGPVSQGLAKPINDVSRGCDAPYIMTMASITALQCGGAL